MAKIYLKKVPCDYICKGCYFFNNIFCTVSFGRTELIFACVRDNIIYIQVSKPIKKIKDLPKPYNKE